MEGNRLHASVAIGKELPQVDPPPPQVLFAQLPQVEVCVLTRVSAVPVVSHLTLAIALVLLQSSAASDTVPKL